MDDILNKIVNSEYKIQTDIAVASDGGTISFTVSNDAGEQHVLFLDRRMMTKTPNVFYAGGYPGTEEAVELGTNEALVALIETTLKETSGQY